MPTPGDAVAEGLLHKVDGGLDAAEQEQRLPYAMPRAVRWMNDKLEGLDADGFFENAPSPMEQAEELFYSFISGEDLESGDLPPHVMMPSKEGVWELRTFDLRFFGWFWRKGIFIISSVDQALNCKKTGLYAVYRNQCVKDRQAFGFDEPSFVEGESINEVI